MKVKVSGDIQGLSELTMAMRLVVLDEKVLTNQDKSALMPTQLVTFDAANNHSGHLTSDSARLIT
jgi:hypothetical protein